MIPELTINNEDELPKPIILTAEEFHKMLLNSFQKDCNLSERWTNEEIRKILLEYAYRGSNITYNIHTSQ
ncbi:hypothetical protein RR46_02517 [Papilio xuthus]|uniref:Uncharacterized protein n=1 Tax=Papilio xuthus TaxID=66420 RepID=A0A194QIR3_PAPXU|nr:hypothetical protein RR46_02517 [Papilio xuthus]